MKITARQLKRIIREERSRSQLSEVGPGFAEELTSEEYAQMMLEQDQQLVDALAMICGAFSDRFYNLRFEDARRRIIKVVSREFARDEVM